MKFLPACIIWLGCLVWTGACSKPAHEPVTGPPVYVPDTPALPVLNGQLVFHAYTCYTCDDSQVYLFDFTTKQLQCLSEQWEIVNPMNAHFSPDGTKITFMGKPKGAGDWDVFLYDFKTAGAPLNLTHAAHARDEDPKFSFDGSKIVFKRNGILTEMDTLGGVLKSYALPHPEASMPYYTGDGNRILYSARETGSERADIFLLSVADGSIRPVAAQPNLEEYYPIVRDDTSFLFTRWRVSGNPNDQVYLGFFDNRASKRLPFNESDHDFSDAYPVSGRYLVLSSTKAGGKGAYDLYVADLVSGASWSLSQYKPNLNTARNELGACYREK